MRDPAALYDGKNYVHYFVTLTTYREEMSLGKPENGTVLLGLDGLLVFRIMKDFSRYVPRVRMDNFTVMPNHVHYILSRECLSGDGNIPDFAGIVSGTAEAFKMLTGEGIYELDCRRDPAMRFRRPRRIWAEEPTGNRIANYGEYLMCFDYINQNPSLWEQDTYYRKPE